MEETVAGAGRVCRAGSMGAVKSYVVSVLMLDAVEERDGSRGECEVVTGGLYELGRTAGWAP
ncbi:uncharacterized protein ColSpa_11478 [Colletotrichum spaethianum]|uniref:Uncharacterized protein n=1 Tax=Colletotrichum spaethianum TaxID=700344 RepID=A0AA37PFN5_9PEZI|nr:uncharacterized protein ColSpa_11478 [Colletotrichum spaethianum]GKT51297.1 hypothetical protein ColSpa_11478 [Colletotrichum spaethianum]